MIPPIYILITVAFADVGSRAGTSASSAAREAWAPPPDRWSAASVNLVQPSFPQADQGDISGISRSVSNLGSSLGTALAGSVLVAASFPGGRPFALALVALGVIALIGLATAVLIPREPAREAARTT
jgi:hypothetical protein